MSGSIYDKLLAFVNGNTTALCNIYKDERLLGGEGLLFIYYEPDSGEVKVCFITRDQLESNILADYDARVANNSSDIIYFFIHAPEQSSFIELDIRDHLRYRRD